MQAGVHHPPPAARCVMLAPASRDACAELQDALDRPDLVTESFQSEIQAFAELCIRARCAVAAAQAGQRAEGLVLLLVDPRELPDPAGLVRAAERYTPLAAVWMFDPDSHPRLRAVTVADVSLWTTHPVPSPCSGHPGRHAQIRPMSSVPPPRLSAVHQPNSSGSAGSGETGQLLSHEELSMLLAEPGEGEHN